MGVTPKHVVCRSLMVVAAMLVSVAAMAAEDGGGAANTWTIGMPIVTYWGGPDMTDAGAQQMKDGGFTVVWCRESELDVAQRHGLRAMLFSGLINPASLDDPGKRAELDALIDRVKAHPAMYAYFIVDEPNASTFPTFARLFEYLRERDPAHLAYLNLLPTYANNDQLGTKGDTATAYAEYLRQYMAIVRPALVSYDHYHFATGGDGDQYFLNLGMIRQTALDNKVPFLNIVQASTWTPSMRVPTRDELRFLLYTTLAYGGQGIMYYVFFEQGHVGAIANTDGTPTLVYHAVKVMNSEFVAIASRLQPLTSLGVYHVGMIPEGGVELPAGSQFRLEPAVARTKYTPPEKMKGYALGTFGPAGGRPTHAVVVNLDYTRSMSTTLVGPGDLEVFDTRTGAWKPAPRGDRVGLTLLPGGGKLVRLRQ